MSIYTRACAGFLFPLHERLKGHESVALRRQLEKSQWWPAERHRAHQFERLRVFLREIGERVPYYRELFRAANFEPSSMTELADLQRLPRLGKAEVRSNLERLKAEGASSLHHYNTGGSTGEPLVFYTGRGRRSHDVAAKWRATRWWGVDVGDPEIVVWGSPIELGAQDRFRALRDALLRSYLLPAFDMSEANLDRYLDTIRARRPAMLFGYPSALFLISLHARKRGWHMDDLGIKVAFVTSERLYDDQRESIEAVFGCRVANGYGGRDAGFIAHECPSGQMHISAEDIVVETLNEEGCPVRTGEGGEIVVTHMATGDFPFVRYRTGDIGVLDPDPCPCGRGLPVLKEVQGRSTDFVVAADGTVMHGLALIYVVRGLQGIERFKIVQHGLSHTEVRLVPGTDYAKVNGTRIVDEFRRRLGRDVTITVRLVDTIPPEASGKYRYVVSAIAASVSRAASTNAMPPHAMRSPANS